MDVAERPLTTAEQEALARYRFINDFSNLAVVTLDTLSRKGEYIVERPEEGEWPELDDTNAWGDSIVCRMLWLARFDAKYALDTGEKKLLKNNIDASNFVYDEFERPDKIHVLGVNDAFANNHLTKQRDERTAMDRYAHHSDFLSTKLVDSAVKDLSLRYERITTGTGDEMLSARLDEGVVFVEIPRGSDPMKKAARQLLPKSPWATFMLQRDEKDPQSRPKKYFEKIPPTIDETKVVVIVDPMLATGGSMVEVIKEVMTYKPKAIKVVAQIAAPEGIRRIQAAYPEVEIWVGQIDSHLDGKNYIRPGLGDAGDRYNGT